MDKNKFLKGFEKVYDGLIEIVKSCDNKIYHQDVLHISRSISALCTHSPTFRKDEEFKDIPEVYKLLKKKNNELGRLVYPNSFLFKD